VSDPRLEQLLLVTARTTSASLVELLEWIRDTFAEAAQGGQGITPQRAEAIARRASEVLANARSLHQRVTMSAGGTDSPSQVH
jgi:hypothetical protein